ncbi:hypothetical protein [Paraburkholderia acidisoli]|uniref:Uncharacterized protein n=1 Tax=Paraburkholderia acidisoli TaxID=2571748 RepID=A0A7Z2GFZ2_9BURK|nr:hypothetical protein [Paraburkholderia acidisoli]QGZ61077.1 hypothetical protein FAZ98_04640 [Paraburkholderia acidisoli]
MLASTASDTVTLAPSRKDTGVDRQTDKSVDYIERKQHMVPRRQIDESLCEQSNTVLTTPATSLIGVIFIRTLQEKFRVKIARMGSQITAAMGARARPRRQERHKASLLPQNQHEVRERRICHHHRTGVVSPMQVTFNATLSKFQLPGILRFIEFAHGAAMTFSEAWLEAGDDDEFAAMIKHMPRHGLLPTLTGRRWISHIRSWAKVEGLQIVYPDHNVVRVSASGLKLKEFLDETLALDGMHHVGDAPNDLIWSRCRPDRMYVIAADEY